MKRSTLILYVCAVATFAALLVTRRGKDDDGHNGSAEARSESRIVITGDAIRVAGASNRFAFDLYRRARTREGNFFLSPASITTAMAMTYAGAAGNTREEMAKVLHFTPEMPVDAGYATFVALLNSAGDQNGYTLSTANKLWSAAGYRMEASFLTLTREQYQAQVETIDFGRAQEARATINGWVKRQTHDKIVELMPPNILDSNTRLVLTNAVYFLGSWAHEFSKLSTRDAPFYRTPDDKFNAPTMYQQRKFGYTDDNVVQVLALPYRGETLSMIIVLPKERAGLAAVEDKLTEEQFTGWVNKLRAFDLVDVYLPKFKFRSRLELSENLKQLGMATAFSDAADFSSISKGEGLKISEVIHEAVVELDEKGTEATAVTAIAAAPTATAGSPPPPPKPILFRADHPFLFAIRHTRTGAILFVGRVERPDR